MVAFLIIWVLIYLLLGVCEELQKTKDKLKIMASLLDISNVANFEHNYTERITTVTYFDAKGRLQDFFHKHRYFL